MANPANSGIRGLEIVTNGRCRPKRAAKTVKKDA